jgi:pyruvate,orthophosphate dikinase
MVKDDREQLTRVDGYAWIVNADPITGAPAILGEVYTTSGRGDALDNSAQQQAGIPLDSLLADQPRLYAQCVAVAQSCRAPARFLLGFDRDGAHVIKNEQLHLTPQAELHYYHEQLQANTIGDEEFLQLISPVALQHGPPHLARNGNEHLVAVTHGMPISGGVATGRLTPDELVLTGHGEGSLGAIVLLDRVEAHHTALLHDHRCAGVLAVRGSSADHFAILAREKGFCYLALPGHVIDPMGLRVSETFVPFGTAITIDFASGRVYLGSGVIEPEADDPAVATARYLLAARPSPLPLRINVDSADDLHAGLPPDAAGIGLVRTEHMLRRGGMTDVLREFTEVDDETEPIRRTLLVHMMRFFQREFARLLAYARGLPVSVRLLDYPLHELGGRLADEVNPMLGLRGVRQGVRWPDLYCAQIDALLQAAVGLRRRGVPVAEVEITVPVVTTVDEVRLIRRWVQARHRGQRDSEGLRVKVGAMVETPAAVAVIDVLAHECDYLTFGTNDLTQLCLGLSREDYVPILELYFQRSLLTSDPFMRLHPSVLAFVREAACRAKAVSPDLTISLCGAQGTDPQVLELAKTGLLDYISLSRHDLGSTKLQAIRLLGDHGDTSGEYEPAGSSRTPGQGRLRR